jgi:hypothetical protein
MPTDRASIDFAGEAQRFAENVRLAEQMDATADQFHPVNQELRRRTTWETEDAARLLTYAVDRDNPTIVFRVGTQNVIVRWEKIDVPHASAASVCLADTWPDNTRRRTVTNNVQKRPASPDGGP